MFLRALFLLVVLSAAKRRPSVVINFYFDGVLKNSEPLGAAEPAQTTTTAPLSTTTTTTLATSSTAPPVTSVAPTTTGSTVEPSTSTTTSTTTSTSTSSSGDEMVLVTLFEGSLCEGVSSQASVAVGECVSIGEEAVRVEEGSGEGYEVAFFNNSFCSASPLRSCVAQPQQCLLCVDTALRIALLSPTTTTGENTTTTTTTSGETTTTTTSGEETNSTITSGSTSSPLANETSFSSATSTTGNSTSSPSPSPSPRSCRPLGNCSSPGTCVSLRCEGHSPSLCPVSPDACFEAVCDSLSEACVLQPLCPPRACQAVTCAMGVCTYTPRPDLELCSDGDQCTLDDVCISGRCRGSRAPDGHVCLLSPCEERRCREMIPGLGGFGCNEVVRRTECVSTQSCEDSECDAVTGLCRQQPRTCHRNDGCSVGYCDPDSDQCVYVDFGDPTPAPLSSSSSTTAPTTQSTLQNATESSLQNATESTLQNATESTLQNATTTSSSSTVSSTAVGSESSTTGSTTFSEDTSTDQETTAPAK